MKFHQNVEHEGDHVDVKVAIDAEAALRLDAAGYPIQLGAKLGTHLPA